MKSIARRPKSLILWVAVLALVVRSLIPAGFMPETSGHGNGLFALTICDGTNHQHHSQDKPGHNHADICPFSVGAVFGFDGINNPFIKPFLLPLANAAPFTLQLLKPSQASSNASPRAPPLFS